MRLHGSTGQATSLGSAKRPRGWLPTYAQTVACPDCKSPVGVPCLTSAGKRSAAHVSRTRIAARERNERLAREAEGL